MRVSKQLGFNVKENNINIILNSERSFEQYRRRQYDFVGKFIDAIKSFEYLNDFIITPDGPNKFVLTINPVLSVVDQQQRLTTLAEYLYQLILSEKLQDLYQDTLDKFILLHKKERFDCSRILILSVLMTTYLFSFDMEIDSASLNWFDNENINFSITVTSRFFDSEISNDYLPIERNTIMRMQKYLSECFGSKRKLEIGYDIDSNLLLGPDILQLRKNNPFFIIDDIKSWSQFCKYIKG